MLIELPALGAIVWLLLSHMRDDSDYRVSMAEKYVKTEIIAAILEEVRERLARIEDKIEKIRDTND